MEGMPEIFQSGDQQLVTYYEIMEEDGVVFMPGSTLEGDIGEINTYQYEDGLVKEQVGLENGGNSE